MALPAPVRGNPLSALSALVSRRRNAFVRHRSVATASPRRPRRIHVEPLSVSEAQLECVHRSRSRRDIRPGSRGRRTTARSIIVGADCDQFHRGVHHRLRHRSAGVVDALVEPRFGDVAHIAGALAFGVGVVFLVVGRTELFNENFFDPAAKAIDEDGSWLLGPSFGCGPSPSSSISSAGSSSRSSSRSTASSRRDRRTHCPGPPKGSSTDRCGYVRQRHHRWCAREPPVVPPRGRQQRPEPNYDRVHRRVPAGSRPVRPRDRHRDSRVFGFLFSTGIGYWALAETVVIATAGNVVGDWVWSRSPTSPRCGARGARTDRLKRDRLLRRTDHSSYARFMIHCEKASLFGSTSSSPINGESMSPAIRRVKSRSRAVGET